MKLAQFQQLFRDEKPVKYKVSRFFLACLLIKCVSNFLFVKNVPPNAVFFQIIPESKFSLSMSRDMSTSETIQRKLRIAFSRTPKRLCTCTSWDHRLPGRGSLPVSTLLARSKASGAQWRQGPKWLSLGFRPRRLPECTFSK